MFNGESRGTPAPSDGQNEPTETITLHIEGMECGCEGSLVERKMKSLAGVQSFELNPITKQLPHPRQLAVRVRSWLEMHLLRLRCPMRRY